MCLKGCPLCACYDYTNHVLAVIFWIFVVALIALFGTKFTGVYARLGGRPDTPGVHEIEKSSGFMLDKRPRLVYPTRRKMFEVLKWCGERRPD